jgi:quercetin dioxygenase-like cupin family protein
MLKKMAKAGVTAFLAAVGIALALSTHAQQGQTVKLLLESSTTVAGAPLKYPAGTPKFTANLSTIEPGGSSPRHQHPVPIFIYVIEGTLFVDVDGAGTREVKAGEGFMEVVDTWHRNRNPSTSARVQYVLVSAGDDKTPFVIRAP